MNPPEWIDLQIAAERGDVADDLGDDSDDEVEDDEEDDDEDDDVGTDERGKEMLKAAGDPADVDANTAEPDVSSDRNAPPGNSSPRRTETNPTKPPLNIKQIEDIEDDAPGG